MKVVRLTKATQVFDNCEFLMEGFDVIRKRDYLQLDNDSMIQASCFLAVRPYLGYVGIVFNSEGKPEGFGIMHESTPLFAKKRCFSSLAIYHKPSNRNLTKMLMKDFDNFCQEQGVEVYYVTSPRFSRAARDCFETYGLRKYNVVFKKEI